MYAVIRAGGKQYRVAPGDVVRVESVVPDGDGNVQFGDVLAISGSEGQIGKPESEALVTGQVLEQGLLHGGDQRSYPTDTVSRVVLGDASAVDVLRDGQAQDLTPFRRANVARFTVSSDGSLAPAVD